LVAAKMNLGGLIQRYPHEVRLEDVAAQIEATIASVRSLTFQVSPPILEDLGLAPALEWLTADLGRQFEKTIHLHITHAPPPMSSRVRLMAFRSVRELLINSAKHSGVDEAHVELDVENASMVLRVWDAGRGFEADKALRSTGQQSGYGLF